MRGKTGGALGTWGTRLPEIVCRYTPEPHSRKPKKEKKLTAGSNIRLSFEQVTEMRRWHEKEGLSHESVFKKAVELGWPINEKHTCRRILDYIQRVKR